MLAVLYRHRLLAVILLLILMAAAVFILFAALHNGEKTYTGGVFVLERAIGAFGSEGGRMICSSL